MTDLENTMKNVFYLVAAAFLVLIGLVILTGIIKVTVGIISFFLPIALMPGPAGEFVGAIAIGVGLSVTTSFALSITLILAFAGWFISPLSERPPAAGAHEHFLRHGWSNARLRDGFRRTVVAGVRRPAVGIGVSVALPILGFLVAPSLPSQFFPANDRDQFQVQLDLPPHAPLEATLAAVARAREVIRAHDEGVESHWSAGEPAARVFYNMMGNYSVPNYAGGFVVTRSPEATERLLPALQRELQEALPGALAIALPFEQGPPFDAPIEVRIVGPELDTLRALGDRVRSVLAETQAVTYTRAKLLVPSSCSPRTRTRATSRASRSEASPTSSRPRSRARSPGASSTARRTSRSACASRATRARRSSASGPRA